MAVKTLPVISADWRCQAWWQHSWDRLSGFQPEICVLPSFSSETCTCPLHHLTSLLGMCRTWKTKVIDATFSVDEGPGGLEAALDRLAAEAEKAVDEGHQLICLSDRNAGPTNVPVNSLLACGCVHHHLIRAQKRTRAGLIIEAGDAREVHQFCTLVGYGADAICPYLAFEAIKCLHAEGRLKGEHKDSISKCEMCHSC